VALGLFWTVNIIVAAASAALLAGLVYVYARNVRQIRSPFTVGLLVFGVLFLVQNLVAIAVYTMMNDAGMGPAVAVPMLVLNGAEFVGFAALFFVTWR